MLRVVFDPSGERFTVEEVAEYKLGGITYTKGIALEAEILQISRHEAMVVGIPETQMAATVLPETPAIIYIVEQQESGLVRIRNARFCTANGGPVSLPRQLFFFGRAQTSSNVTEIEVSVTYIVNEAIQQSLMEPGKKHYFI